MRAHLSLGEKKMAYHCLCLSSLKCSLLYNIIQVTGAQYIDSQVLVFIYLTVLGLSCHTQDL